MWVLILFVHLNIKSKKMENLDHLSLRTKDTGLCVVFNELFIGSPDNDSEQPDVSFEWRIDGLHIDGWKLSPSQLYILTAYINKQI